jgi:hypothetical protein
MLAAYEMERCNRALFPAVDALIDCRQTTPWPILDFVLGHVLENPANCARPEELNPADWTAA